jgi:hypothetical protein
MEELGAYCCPSCGEPIDVRVDPSAGSRQEYVEDCPVCCRPNVLRIQFDADGGVTIDARSE